MRKVDSEPAPNKKYWAPHALDCEIERLDRRAGRNRRKARLATLTIVATSAMAPLALLASTKWQYFTLEKLIPGVLAAFAALATKDSDAAIAAKRAEGTTTETA